MAEKRPRLFTVEGPHAESVQALVDWWCEKVGHETIVQQAARLAMLYGTWDSVPEAEREALMRLLLKD